MYRGKLLVYARPLLLAAVIVIGCAGTALAQTSSSTNYQAGEMQFGAGSSVESCSEGFCARASIGSLTGDEAGSATKTAAFGPITPEEPLLEVIVDQGESNLGVLTTEKTATKTMNVRVRSYLSDGYMMQIVGDPPKYKDHTLRPLTTLATSTPGVEQFGINVAANTTPSIGANPVQVPSSDMSFGEATEDYSIPNQFKYVSGDVVARSLTESGRTDYTVSMIVNISSATPAGHFTGDYAAIVIPGF